MWRMDGVAPKHSDLSLEQALDTDLLARDGVASLRRALDHLIALGLVGVDDASGLYLTSDGERVVSTPAGSVV